jgi:hypothetical protein
MYIIRHTSRSDLRFNETLQTLAPSKLRSQGTSLRRNKKRSACTHEKQGANRQKWSSWESNPEPSPLSNAQGAMLRRCHTTRPQPHLMEEILTIGFIITFSSPNRKLSLVRFRLEEGKRAGGLQTKLSCKTNNFRELLGGYMHNKSRVKKT